VGLRVVWDGCFKLLAILPILGCCGLALAGCSNPTDPSAPLQITCPASTAAESLTGDPVAVEFGSATTTGGNQPVVVTCTAQNGSNFQVGTTNVVCSARDAKQRLASCGLNVTVTRVGELSATRFLAFGDSITFGSPGGTCPAVQASAMTPALRLQDILRLRPRVDVPPPPSAYPNVLRALLANRYVAQSFTVDNAGEPGEGIVAADGGTNDDTLDRLRASLRARAPQVLLLQEGINDLNQANHHLEIIGPLIKALHDMIREARIAGVSGSRVFLGTLLPVDPSGCRGGAAFDLVGPANEQIRAMAASEGVTLVDLYAGFGGVPGPYLGFDGLHPNELGYEKMAQIFLTAIRTTLEQPR
jgi:lysophospholipase L1-like esterase